jgi:hypothetical protein
VRPGEVEAPADGREIFVIDGELRDENEGEVYGRHTWLRLPGGSRYTPFTPETTGCTLLVKDNGLPYAARPL